MAGPLADQTTTHPPLPGYWFCPASGHWSPRHLQDVPAPTSSPSAPSSCLCSPWMAVPHLAASAQPRGPGGQKRECSMTLPPGKSPTKASPRRTDTGTPVDPKDSGGAPTEAKCCMGSLMKSMVGARGSAHAGELVCRGTRHGCGWPGGRGQGCSRLAGWTGQRSSAARGPEARDALEHVGWPGALWPSPSPQCCQLAASNNKTGGPALYSS